MQRRDFLRACAAACAAGGLPAHAAEPLVAHRYQRTLLVGTDGAALDPAALAPEQNYLFNYPYAGTPCFLFRLSHPAPPVAELQTGERRRYAWPGGVGPQRNIVAYSAICAHKLAYPTRQISFISYRPRPSVQGAPSRVIHCCSEHSQYDPARGARVVAGPARQPLAAILLEHEADSGLYAVGTLGGEMFRDFFAKYAFRLGMEYGPDKAALPVGERTQVVALEDYCRQQVHC